MRTDFKSTSRSKSKSAAEKGTSQAIAEHTAAFLKAGGKISRYRSGTRELEVPAGKESLK